MGGGIYLAVREGWTIEEAIRTPEYILARICKGVK